jgi:hypothetical protein
MVPETLYQGRMQFFAKTLFLHIILMRLSVNKRLFRRQINHVASRGVLCFCDFVQNAKTPEGISLPEFFGGG